MFFDARAAKLLKPGEHLNVMGCSGLRLAATNTTKTWTYRYKDPGSGLMKKTRLGHWPAMPAASAAAKWQELRDARATGESPQELQRADRVGPVAAPVDDVYSVRSLVGDYITGDLVKSRKEAGAKAAQRILERFLQAAPELASKPIEQTTRAECFDALEALQDTPTVAAKLRSLLGSAWEYGLDSGRIGGDTPNWWRMVMRGRLKSKGKIMGGEHVGKKRRALTQTEVGQLLAWLPNMHSLAQDMTVMYLWTCCRGSEAVSMTAEHIHREGKQWWWIVPLKLTKNANVDGAVDLRVPLFGRALEVVQRRMKEVGLSGLLFEDGRGEQYTQHDFSTYIYDLQPYSAKVKRRQGEGLVLPVTNWSPHDLRRTSRTALTSIGCPTDVAEAIIGHMPAVLIATYNVHTYDAERVLWLGKLNNWLITAEVR